jgi:hypothetical protein
MDIKHELRQTLHSPNVDLPGCDYLTQLCQKALAEIEGLETACAVLSNSIGARYPHLRQVEALEKIAQSLRSIEETMTIWHTVGVPGVR